MMVYNTNVFPIKTIKLSDVYIKCLLARDSPPSPSPLFFFFSPFFNFTMPSLMVRFKWYIQIKNN